MIEHARVLKSGDTFAVFDPFGNIDSASPPELGLYVGDTRFCSRAKLLIEGHQLVRRSSAITADNVFLVVDLECAAPGGLIEVQRRIFVHHSTCYQRLHVRNSTPAKVEVALGMEFDADYTDLFEIRGVKRGSRGRQYAVRSTPNALEFEYEGLDGQRRLTSVLFEPAPAEFVENRARCDVRLEPGGESIHDVVVQCRPGDSKPLNYEQAEGKAIAAFQSMKNTHPSLITSNEKCTTWLDRSFADLCLLRTETDYGPYPYAGLPWYSTPFGRDGLITALECLWLFPEIGRGVLSYLAATQARDENRARDAQPGKILHETRSGEMAALGEVPFDRYYGSVDATPLFVILAGEYYDRTADSDFVKSIWPNVERALEWIDRYGDPDGDGFVEYAGTSPGGLRNQGWKDSDGAIFHADGKLAEGPVAVCEVQGYVYAAKLSAAKLARLFRMESLAAELEAGAETLRRRFEETFWCEEIATYALALDGNKQLCRVQSSNAGHCLFAGIVSDDRARKLAATLTGAQFFSGWGVRTIASNEVRYDARSYHNGSIWPHDNALIASGLARYGFAGEAGRILTGLFEATEFFESRRLPELFCGFPRCDGEGPVHYPVSCSPQAWAACAPFLLLKACIGINIDVYRRRIVFDRPYLPEFLSDLEISRLPIGDAFVDLRITGRESDVTIEVLRQEGEASVVVNRN